MYVQLTLKNPKHCCNWSSQYAEAAKQPWFRWSDDGQ